MAQVAALIERVQPDTLVTFGPDGMTGHPDHQTVSAWVTEAWRRAGGQARLWYATTHAGVPGAVGGAAQRAGHLVRRASSHPGPPPPPSWPPSVECDDGLLDLKHQVLRAHASQTAGLRGGRLGNLEVFRSWWATEYFVAARP